MTKQTMKRVSHDDGSTKRASERATVRPLAQTELTDVAGGKNWIVSNHAVVEPYNG